MEKRNEPGGRKRVLIVLDTLRRGGIEIAALRFAKLLDKRCECTFFVRRGEEIDESMRNAVAEDGSRIIVMPRDRRGYIKEYFFLLKTMREGKYNIVHSHLLFYNGIVMLAAYKAGVEKRVAQSHATENNRACGTLRNAISAIYKRVMRGLLRRCATDVVGCSEKAGIYMCGERLFRERGKVLPNYVDTDEYSFSAERRIQKRKELGLADELLIGHTGSVYWIKNQTFLVSLFAQLVEIRRDARLILVGEEADGGETRALAGKLGVTDKVMFMGSRSDIPDLLNAMDVFVFPSRFEALPIAPIEAQATGLPCVASQGVPEEIGVTDAFVRLPLEAPASQWIEKICEFSNFDRAGIDLTKLHDRYSAESVREKLLSLYSL